MKNFKKFKIIIVHFKVYEKLLEIKSELQKRFKKNMSFTTTIEFLINEYEKSKENL
jgi:hypothetical protein